MICKRCGAECGSEDKFCRICGAKFKSNFNKPVSPAASAASEPESEPVKNTVDYAESFSEPSGAMPRTRKKRLFLISALVVFLILIAALIWIFIPQFKQSFMSPAAFYIDSETRQVTAVIDTLSDEISGLTSVETAEVSGIVSFAAEGEQFDDETRELLDRLNLLMDVQIESGSGITFDCGASFDNRFFCSILASLVKDEFTLRFPDMTEAQVTQKLTDALYQALQGENDVLETATGVTRADLKAWIAGYLQDVLRPALDEAEQTLDTTELGGAPTSIVTFTLSEKTVKKLISNYAKLLRRDETLLTICENLTEFIGASEAFKDALRDEFGLTDEELDELPVLEELCSSIQDALDRRLLFAEPELDFPLVYAYGTTREEIRASLEARAERLIDHADDLSITEPVSLIVYYQGTELVGRHLLKGNKTLFSAFTTVKDNRTTFTVSFSDSAHLYTLSVSGSQSNGERNFDLEFSREARDDGSGDKTDAEHEKLWSISGTLKTNTLVGGVHALTGEVKINYGDEILTFSNEKVSDTDTLFTYECRKIRENASSKFKIRANLTYSSDYKKEEIHQSIPEKKFTHESYREILDTMREKLSGTPLYARIFGSDPTSD